MNSAEYQFRIPLQALFKQHEFVSYRAEVFVGSAGYVQDAFYGLAGRQRFRDSYGSGKTVSFRSGGISLLACYIFVGFAGVSERESYLKVVAVFFHVCYAEPDFGVGKHPSGPVVCFVCRNLVELRYWYVSESVVEIPVIVSCV